MKRLLLFFVTVVMATSCASSAKLINSATYSKAKAVQPVAALYADLKVSPAKISFFHIPSKTVVMGGYDNVINTAVREALASNGNADVLVALETQVKYNSVGEIESVTVTGYPATYTNFRSPSDEVLSNMVNTSAAPAGNSLMGGVKLGF